MSLLLVASILPLLIGPLLVRLLKPAPWAHAALDAFVLVSIGGLALLDILPECFEVGGWLAVAGAFFGLTAPTWAERTVQSAHGSLWLRPILAVALLALLAHATIDGVALTGAKVQEAHAQALAVAVIVHRVPVGLSLWWFVRSKLGLRAAVLTLGVELCGTLIGFFFGDFATRGSSSQALAIFQALVAGSLLHVIVGHSHEPEPSAHPRVGRIASAVGGLIAVGFLVAIHHLHPAAHEHESSPAFVTAFLDLAYASALPLLVAYGVVAVASALIPRFPTHVLSGGSALSQALRGVGLGMPTTICTCGVLPPQQRKVVAAAPPAAAVAFIVAASSLGLAAVLLSFRLLGWRVSLMRVAAAAVLALLAGLWSGRLVANVHAPATEHPAPHPDDNPAFLQRLLTGLRFEFGETLDHTAPWFLMGLALAAFAQTYLRPEWVAALPPGLDVVVAALFGVPTYVCASGATPLAAVLMGKGVSPGAMIAFLLSGPATTLAMFGTPAEVYGRRVVVLLGVGIVVVSTAAGYAANHLLSASPVPSEVLASQAHRGAVETVALILLSLAVLASLFRQGVRGFVQRVAVSPPVSGDAPQHDHAHSHG